MLGGGEGVSTWDMWGLGGQVVYTHSAEHCEPPCPLHYPSDHPLKDAPLRWREDRHIWERICPHGIGHNDPDSTAYNRKHGFNDRGDHGCDGCCMGVSQ